MNLIITPPQEIVEELTDIDRYLNSTMSEDGEEAQLRGNDLAVHMARSGKLLSDAKYHLNDKKKSEVFETLEKTAKHAGATAKAVNAIIDSLCKEEQYLVDWAGRINATCTHQMDWCRSVLSKAKEEMRIAGYNRG